MSCLKYLTQQKTVMRKFSLCVCGFCVCVCFNITTANLIKSKSFYFSQCTCLPQQAESLAELYHGNAYNNRNFSFKTITSTVTSLAITTAPMMFVLIWTLYFIGCTSVR